MVILAPIDFALIFFTDYFILHNLLEYKQKNKWSVFAFPIIFSGITISSIYMGRTYLIAVGYLFDFLICIFFRYLFLEIKLLTVVKTFFFTYFLNVLICSLFTYICNIPYSDIVTVTVGTIIDLLFLTSAILIYFKKRTLIQLVLNSTTKVTKNILYAALIISATFAGLLSDAPHFETYKEWDTIIRVLAFLFIITVVVILIIMFFNFVEKSVYKKTSETYEQQIRIQANHYANIAKSNYDLRKFKHDYKNMHIGIVELINQNKTDDALEMLNSGDEILSKIDSMIGFNTGNEIVNAILADKQIKATKSNTIIEFSGSVHSELISSLDLCIIFGNVLDNAIEACEKISGNEPKTIVVNSDYSAGLVFLTITNPVKNNISIKSNSISTTKLDKSNHGFGIYSIKKALEKYNGQITLYCEDYKFTTEINFEMPSTAKV